MENTECSSSTSELSTFLWLMRKWNTCSRSSNVKPKSTSHWDLFWKIVEIVLCHENETIMEKLQTVCLYSGRHESSRRKTAEKGYHWHLIPERTNTKWRLYKLTNLAVSHRYLKNPKGVMILYNTSHFRGTRLCNLWQSKTKPDKFAMISPACLTITLLW